MSRNTGQQPSTEPSGTGKSEQLHTVTWLYMMLFGVVNFILVLWLAWKVFDPEMWFPTMSPGTFIVAEVLMFIFWILQLQRVEKFTGKKDPSQSRPPR